MGCVGARARNCKPNSVSTRVVKTSMLWLEPWESESNEQKWMQTCNYYIRQKRYILLLMTQKRVECKCTFSGKFTTTPSDWPIQARCMSNTALGHSNFPRLLFSSWQCEYSMSIWCIYYIDGTLLITDENLSKVSDLEEPLLEGPLFNQCTGPPRPTIAIHLYSTSHWGAHCLVVNGQKSQQR